MDRAVIIGTYESLGFRFCTSLLEEGYEVTGIHYRNMDEELVEEKRMEIGRNANFQEVLQMEWLPPAEIQEQTLIIIDFNYFYLRKPGCSLEISEHLEKFLVHNDKKIKDTQSKVICLLPIEDHVSTNERFNKIILNVKANDYHYLYLSRELDIQKESIKDLIEGGF
ncbi:hypothetical protein ACFFHH_17985 [Cytobacillus solani]|uniref:hypothetical protein n=1 Tax=Cytobacillus solani TaxID=1637975 RepID=UPI0006ABC670|nr:hypothetical protein [Cytobacillus solani]